jgi:VWFA-related protein
VTRLHRLRLLVVLSLGAAVASAPTSAAPQQRTPPVFGTSTGLVLVDFVVTDSKGKPAVGLTQRDFVVKEDGKERPISSFVGFVNGKSQPDPNMDVVVLPGTEPPRATTSVAVTVLFVDDGQLSPQQATRLKPALKELILTLGRRGGVLALAAPWSKTWLAHGVEGNVALFTAAVDRISGRKFADLSTYPVSDAEAFAGDRGEPETLARLAQRFVALNQGLDGESATIAARIRSAEVAKQARNRREDAYGTIFKALDWLAQLPGRHSLVIVSAGHAHDFEDTKQQEIVSRSLRANAPIHFLDARGLEGFGRFEGVEYRESLGQDAGETTFAFANAAAASVSLSEDTGGIAVRNTNDLSTGLTRVFDTMSNYYVLGYEPEANSQKGFRKIRVECKVIGVNVLARKGYVGDRRR